MSRGLALDVRPNLAFQSILQSLFQIPDRKDGIAIAFTSANSGEGVSYVSEQIAFQLSASRPQSTAYLSAEQLARSAAERPTMQRHGSVAVAEPATRLTWDDWRESVSQLRARHRYSIIDCPSLSTGSEVLSLAPHLDGIVIVVAANSTHKTQVANVERQIQMVNGKVLGLVLNKRQYPVPNWLYKRL